MIRFSVAASVSQQNSPRRSLIPQPTYRQRSTSLTKTNERSPSPKIGRRVDSRTRLNVSNSRDRLNATELKSTRLNDSRTRLNKADSKSRTSNLGEPRIRFISNSTSNLSSNNLTASRRQTTRASTRLSPIQGTPTKPEKASTQSSMRGDRASRPSPARPTPRTSPQKNSNVATRRDTQNRNTSRERVVSPSKIPLKAANRNGSFNTSSNTGRFISMPDQGSEGAKKAGNKAERAIKEERNDKQTVQNGHSPESNSRESEMNGNSSGQTDEVDLIDLLKQTSHAIGTSSERLVNTTTSTAVKPLHIDANTLLAERSDGSIASQPRDRDVSKSSGSPASKDESLQPVPMQSAASMSQRPAPTMESQPVRTSQTQSNAGNEKKDSPVGAEATSGGHSKSGSVGQSARNASRVNGNGSAHLRSSNQSSANQRSARNGPSTRGSKPSDGKVSEESVAASTATSVEVKSGSAGSKLVAGVRESPANDRMPTVIENDAKSTARATEQQAGTKSTAAMSNAMANSATVKNATGNSKAANNAAKGNHDNHADSAAGGAVNASVNSGAVRTRKENRGSDASLKSSTGVSTDSIESVRSTDTGVSVNTVRGVSSPREKTGVHVVKRQEIETLSGNIVCVEQNGEPA